MSTLVAAIAHPVSRITTRMPAEAMTLLTTTLTRVRLVIQRNGLVRRPLDVGRFFGGLRFPQSFFGSELTGGLGRAASIHEVQERCRETRARFQQIQADLVSTSRRSPTAFSDGSQSYDQDESFGRPSGSRIT